MNILIGLSQNLKFAISLKFGDPFRQCLQYGFVILCQSYAEQRVVGCDTYLSVLLSVPLSFFHARARAHARTHARTHTHTVFIIVILLLKEGT